MKKVLGILAVVALLTAPVMAADVPVTITVSPYCAIVTAPGALVMTANDVQHSGVAVYNGLHQAETPFTVQGNKSFTATLTSQFTSNSAGDVPGGTQPTYPTAYIGGTNSDLTKGIGFGPSVVGLTNGGADLGWNGIALKETVSLNAGVTSGTIRINTYIDSGRTGVALGGGQAAGPGTYTCNLYLTLAVAP